MTIKDAINHAKDVADKKYIEGFLCYANSGDVENDKKNDECVECAKEHEQLAEWLEELQKYLAIGTAEECREAVEKQKAKEPSYKANGCDKYGNDIWDEWSCPNCRACYEVGYDEYDYCPYCGQAISWEDGDAYEQNKN